MRKDKFFIEALKADCYKSKEWVISAFSIIQKTSEKMKQKPYEIILSPTGWVFYNPGTSQYEPLVDTSNQPLNPKSPPFTFSENIVVMETDVINVSSTIKTTYGILLVNYFLLIYPFGNKLPFMNEEIKIKNIEASIKDRLVDNGSKESKDPKYISVDEYKEFVRASSQLEGFAQLCVPCLTEKALMTDPKVKEVIAELKEKYKDSLNDPLTISRIDAEVERLDRAWLKGDPSERFYLENKSWTITRKKMYSLYGGESGMGGAHDIKFIDKPLSAGIDIDSLPEMVNALRSGSYGRGIQTAMGGVAVKDFFRVFQNSNITEKDCGDVLGIQRTVKSHNWKQFVGFYYIEKGKIVFIDDEVAKGLVDKTIQMRSPAACKTPLTDYCETCMGVNNSRSKQGLGAAASQIGSKFMGIFMAAMHGKALQTQTFSIVEDIC